MKLLIISDIHGSSYYAKKLEEIYNKEEPDKLIILGDLYYHGPRNELTQEYGPMEVAKILNSLKENMLVVKGNCDAEVDETISEFKFNENIELEIDGLNMFFTHGQIQHGYIATTRRKNRYNVLWTFPYRIYKRRKWNNICKSRFNFFTKKRK